MASPVRNARLRAPAYTPIEHSPDLTPSSKNIIFDMNVSRLQRDIRSGAQVLFLPEFINETLTLAMIQYVITVEGTFDNSPVHGTHTANAVVSGTPHTPDFIDFEEAALFFNHDFCFDEATGKPINLPELQVEFGEGNLAGIPEFRIYQGMILSMEIALSGGKWAGEFTMVFGVVWSSSNPILREWTD